QGLARGLDPQLGAAAEGGLADILEPLAVALEDDRVGDRAGLEPAEIAGDAEAAHVAGAHGSVPGGLDVARFLVRGDAVVDDDVGAGLAADRAVEVAERRALVGRAA